MKRLLCVETRVSYDNQRCQPEAVVCWMQSWVNIAIMSERLGVDVWYRGLGDGWSIKDAFDQNRGYFESLGLTWPFEQVGIPRVRVAGQLVLPIYVGYRLRVDPPRVNSGPVEYIQLYTDMWKSFTTSGSQVLPALCLFCFCCLVWSYVCRLKGLA
jgi:hypothetical protein